MGDSLVLFSGGLDSAVLLETEHRRGTLGAVVHFVYPHPSQSHERRAVIASKLRLSRQGSEVPWFEIDLPLRAKSLSAGIGASGPRVVAARNAAFLAVAVNLAASIDLDRVLFGATETDASEYADCRLPYVVSFSKLMEPYGVTVCAPFAKFNRAQIRIEAQRLGLQPQDFWSCYEPRNGKPCGTCDSCAQDTEVMP